MSYSGPFINSIFKTDAPEDQNPISIQNNGGYIPSVTITYNGSGLHDVAHGPTPLVTLSHTYNRTETGMLLSITNKLNITGRIYDRSITDSKFIEIMEYERNLKNLFKDCAVGVLEIKCNSAVVLSATGARVLSMSTEQSPDNITRSLGYNIDLEYYEKAVGTDDFLITSCSDSWSIEPVEDYFHESFSAAAISRRSEPGTGAKTTPPTALTIKNVPQFRLSHRVSAKGALGTGLCSVGSGTGYLLPYQQAQKWVKTRLNQAISSSAGSGAYLGQYGTAPPVGDLWLYNHVRATNFSMTEGTYEVTDTWLAMPTGITHVEDYTIDVSTDEKFIKTVRVQGTIRGLDMAASGRLAGDGSLTPSGNGQITLSPSTQTNLTGGSPSYAPERSLTTSISSNRYENALIAWHSGVKPSLYTRASMVMNASNAYTTNYTRDSANIANNYNRENPALSPIYCSDRLLNVIPWSTSESHDTKKGVITYGYEYNNKYTLLSGVISENITVTDNAPVDVVAEVFVLGRKLGPVLQALGARTTSTKDVSIDITVMPITGIDAYFMSNSACPLFTGGTLYGYVQMLVEGLRPFGTRDAAVFGSNTSHNTTGQVYVDRDTQSWNPVEGRYSRNVSWKYQQCTNQRYYLDH